MYRAPLVLIYYDAYFKFTMLCFNLVFLGEIYRNGFAY